MSLNDNNEMPPSSEENKVKTVEVKRELEGDDVRSSDTLLSNGKIDTSTELPQVCCVCNKTFKKKNDLCSHMFTHAPKYQCSECSRNFHNAHRLKMHSFVHNDGGPSQCSYCKKTFVSKLKLDQHITIHEMGKHVPKIFRCDQCSITYRSLNCLKRHLLRHSSEKRYVCKQCGRNFKWRNSLRLHEHTHTDEDPFLCSECGKKFQAKGYLKRHEQRRHKSIADSQKIKAPQAVKVQTIKPRSECTICGNLYAKADSLKRHMVTHGVGQKPRCEVCDKEFTQSSSLKEHMLLHSGERPHKCEACGRRFAQKSTLRNHTATCRLVLTNN